MYKMSDYDCVHVIGNGPSIKCFESDLFHQEPTDGVRVCCNLGIPHLNPIWTFMTQPVLFYLCDKQIDFKIPMVAVLHDIQKIKQEALYPQHLRQLNFHHVLGLTPGRDYNSGMKACLTALTMYSPTTLHLWGLDFLWTESTESVQDHWPGFNKYSSMRYWGWKESWNEIFTTNPKTQFVIHTPTPIIDLPKNVATERL